MTFDNINPSIIIFVVGQTATAAWAIITTHFKVRAIEQKLVEMEKENHALKIQLKELSDTLLIVKNNTELLVLGKLKTGPK
jgi:regulator of replication initiation timing